MISAGRGSEKPSETAIKTDLLSEEIKGVEQRHGELRDEVQRRYGSNIHRLPKGKGFGPRN
jgi:hypothetical protein